MLLIFKHWAQVHFNLELAQQLKDRTEQTKMDWKNNAVWGKIYAFMYNASVTQPDRFNRK